MLNRLYYILNVRREEAPTVISLLSFSFFSGLAIAFFYTASTSIFLSFFSREIFPLGYLVMGIVGYLFWWLLALLDKNKSFSFQIISKFSFLILSVIILSLSWIYFQELYVAFSLFIWIRILLLISTLVFWGLAGKLFNLQQGKRLFGLIAAGEVCSSMIGFFSIPFLVDYKILQTNDLLLASCACLCIALLILMGILHKNQDVFKFMPPLKRGSKPVSFRELVKQMQRPYFQYIFILAFLPVFVLIYVDFIFLDEISLQFEQSPDQLATFLALFFGSISLLELIIKLFLSGRMLSRYGLKVGLAILPIFLVVLSSMSVIFGSVMGEESILFFYCAVGVKLVDRVFRSSLYEPAFQILYQPLPHEERFAFQNKVEGIPKTLGNILAGLVLLLFVETYPVGLVLLLAFLTGISGLWWYASAQAYQEYKEMVMVALSVPSTEANKTQTIGGFEFIKQLISSPQHIYHYIARFIWKTLAPHRLEKKEHTAIKSSTDSSELTSYIANLSDPAFALSAMNELISVGKESVNLIQAKYSLQSTPLTQLKFAWTLSYASSEPHRCRNLIAFIEQSHSEVIPALLYFVARQKCQSEILQKSLVYKWVYSTIEHIIWTYASIRDLTGKSDTSQVCTALEDEQSLAYENLYILLGSLFGHDHIFIIRDNLNYSYDESKNAYALELIDMIVDHELKAILITLCEPVPLTTRLRRIEEIYPQPFLSAEDRLKEILNRKSPLTSSWVKVHALLSLAQIAPPSPKELFLYMKYPSSLIQETARNLLSIQSHSTSESNNIQHYYPNHALTIFNRVYSLSKLSCFHHLAPQKLSILGELFDGKYLMAGEQFQLANSTIYWVIRGLGAVQTKNNILSLIKCLEMYLPPHIKENDHLYFVASKDTFLLFINQFVFYDYLISYPFITHELLSLLFSSPSFSSLSMSSVGTTE